MTIGYAGAFLGGLAALLSPCAAMLLPSFFAYAFGGSRTRLIGRTGLFYVGLLVTLLPLGLAAGALGAMLATHRSTLALVGGAILVLFGILQVLGVEIPLPGVRRGSGGTEPLSVVMLGAVYGLAGACTGPLLGAVLTMAAVSGSPVYGALLLALFGAGMAVPLLVLALVWDKFSVGEKLRPVPLQLGPVSTTLWGVLAGGLFILLGLLFLLTDATGALGGVLDARQQLSIEAWLRGVGERIPDPAMLLGIALAAGGLVWWAGRRSHP